MNGSLHVHFMIKNFAFGIYRNNFMIFFKKNFKNFKNLFNIFLFFFQNFHHKLNSHKKKKNNYE